MRSDFMFAVVRLKGSISLRRELADTLTMLNLRAPQNCVIVPEDETHKGMLQKVRDMCTWGEVDAETLAALLKKKLRMKGELKVDESLLKQQTSNDSFENFAKGLIDGKTKFDAQFEKTLRLRPPSKGLKSIHEFYPKGDLGYRGKEINELLKRMI